MDEFLRFRSHFPMLEQYTYLNTAAWGVLHDGLLEWRQGHDLDYLVGGSRMKIGALSLLEDTREHLGRFFNCPAKRISLVPNFSLGMDLLLEGLKRDSEVLTLEGDYPSLTWPFHSRGFPCGSTFRARTGRADTRGVVSVAFPGAGRFHGTVDRWCSISPDFLKRVKERFPDLLIIADATQYAGAFQLDFEDSGIDVLGASGYKWLLGGNGNGFMLFSPEAENAFQALSTGFNSVNADLSRKDEIRFSKHFEPRAPGYPEFWQPELRDGIAGGSGNGCRGSVQPGNEPKSTTGSGQQGATA